LGGRVCGAELVDVGRDSAGRKLLACPECKWFFEVRPLSPSDHYAESEGRGDLVSCTAANKQESAE
jgi:hypothetical protein